MAAVKDFEWEMVQKSDFDWTFRMKIPGGSLYRHVEMTSARVIPGVDQKLPPMTGRQPHAMAVSMCYVPDKKE